MSTTACPFDSNPTQPGGEKMLYLRKLQPFLIAGRTLHRSVDERHAGDPVVGAGKVVTVGWGIVAIDLVG